MLLPLDFSLYIAASIFQPLYRRLYIAVPILQPIYCSLYIAAPILQPLYCSLYISASISQPLYCSLYIAASILQPLYCSLFIAGSRSPPGLPTGPHDPLSAFEMTRLALLKVRKYTYYSSSCSAFTFNLSTLGRNGTYGTCS